MIGYVHFISKLKLERVSQLIKKAIKNIDLKPEFDYYLEVQIFIKFNRQGVIMQI